MTHTERVAVGMVGVGKIRMKRTLLLLVAAAVPGVLMYAFYISSVINTPGGAGSERDRQLAQGKMKNHSALQVEFAHESSASSAGDQSALVPDKTYNPFSKSQIETARSIIDFIETGSLEKIRDIPGERMRDLITICLSEISPDRLAESLEKNIGLPYGIFYSVPDPGDYLMEVVESLRGDVDRSELSSKIIITDSCASDGSVLGAAHIIPDGTKTVFAVFENQGPVEKLGYIYAVWRDLNNDKIQFSEYEPLRIGTRYNYVWLQLNNGWPEGVYQVDLADPYNPSRILATTKFRVR